MNGVPWGFVDSKPLASIDPDRRIGAAGFAAWSGAGLRVHAACRRIGPRGLRWRCSTNALGEPSGGLSDRAIAIAGVSPGQGCGRSDRRCAPGYLVQIYGAYDDQTHFRTYTWHAADRNPRRFRHPRLHARCMAEAAAIGADDRCPIARKRRGKTIGRSRQRGCVQDVDVAGCRAGRRSSSVHCSPRRWRLPSEWTWLRPSRRLHGRRG